MRYSHVVTAPTNDMLRGLTAPGPLGPHVFDTKGIIPLVTPSSAPLCGELLDRVSAARADAYDRGDAQAYLMTFPEPSRLTRLIQLDRRRWTRVTERERARLLALLWRRANNPDRALFADVMWSSRQRLTIREWNAVVHSSAENAALRGFATIRGVCGVLYSATPVRAVSPPMFRSRHPDDHSPYTDPAGTVPVQPDAPLGWRGFQVPRVWTTCPHAAQQRADMFGDAGRVLLMGVRPRDILLFDDRGDGQFEAVMRPGFAPLGERTWLVSDDVNPAWAAKWALT